MSKNSFFYLDENEQVQEAEVIDPQQHGGLPKFHWRIEEEQESFSARNARHNAEIEAERNARIARQQAADVYTPEPTHPDLPLNQNRVSDFEYRYGEAAFIGGSALIVILIVLFIYYSNRPM